MYPENGIPLYDEICKDILMLILPILKTAIYFFFFFFWEG